MKETSGLEIMYVRKTLCFRKYFAEQFHCDGKCSLRSDWTPQVNGQLELLASHRTAAAAAAASMIIHMMMMVVMMLWTQQSSCDINETGR